MMSHCRVNDLSPSSGTVSRFMEKFDQRDEKCLSVVNGEVTVTISVSEIENLTENELWSIENCTTPTAKEYRIPEIQTCPPPPKKRRPSTFSHLPSVPLNQYFIPTNLETIFVLEKVSKVK